jgi:hypothetical protein
VHCSFPKSQQIDLDFSPMGSRAKRAQLLLRGYETEGAADAADSEVEVWFSHWPKDAKSHGRNQEII